MPAGRPSKYETRYCEEVIVAAREGLSLTGFAGKIEVARSTINEWIEQYPEFSEAVSCAKAVRALAWERRAIKVGDGDGGPGAAPMIQFALRNLADDDWRDRRELEHAGRNGGAIQVANTTRVVIVPAKQKAEVVTRPIEQKS